MVAGFAQIVINIFITILEFITWRITALSVELECKKRGINKVDEPIISPWLIYLIGSVDGVLALVGIIGFCSLALAVACFMESITTYLEENEKHEWRKRSKIFLIGSIISISLYFAGSDPGLRVLSRIEDADISYFENCTGIIIKSRINDDERFDITFNTMSKDSGLILSRAALNNLIVGAEIVEVREIHLDD